MHEVGVAQSIMDIVLDSARKNEAKSVNKVGITVGSLSGVEPQSLAFALDAVKEGTLAHKADFELVLVSAKGLCGDCQKESEPDTFFSVCAHCGSPALEIIEGQEFKIDFIDIEE